MHLKDVFDSKFLILSTNLLVVKTIQEKRLNEAVVLTKLGSLGVIVTERSKQFGESRVFLKGMCAWGVDSTVNMHSDYFVRKDTSEHATRRCDHAVVKKQVNSCV